MSANTSTTTAAPLFYLAALNSAINVGILVAQLVTVLLMGTLLLLWICSHKSLKKISHSMIFFLVGHAIGNVATLPYTVQRLFWLWDPAQWLYGTFWLGVINGDYLAISSYFGLYLTMDRLLVLMLPYGILWPKMPLESIRRAFLMFSIIICLALYVMLSWLYTQAFPLDAKTTFGPVPTPIIMFKQGNALTFQSMMKPIIGGMNMVASLFFLLKIRQSNIKNTKDRLIKFTAWAELLMDIVPYAITQAFQMITNQSISNYTGSLRTLLTYAEPAVCAIYYTAMFIKWGAKGRVFASTIRSKKQQLQQQLQEPDRSNYNKNKNNYNNNGMIQLTVATRVHPMRISSMPNMATPATTMMERRQQQEQY